jgi:hypothetical protein
MHGENLRKFTETRARTAARTIFFNFAVAKNTVRARARLILRYYRDSTKFSTSQLRTCVDCAAGARALQPRFDFHGGRVVGAIVCSGGLDGSVWGVRTCHLVPRPVLAVGGDGRGRGRSAV